MEWRQKWCCGWMGQDFFIIYKKVFQQLASLWDSPKFTEDHVFHNLFQRATMLDMKLLLFSSSLWSFTVATWLKAWKLAQRSGKEKSVRQETWPIEAQVPKRWGNEQNAHNIFLWWWTPQPISGPARTTSAISMSLKNFCGSDLLRQVLQSRSCFRS